MVSTFGRLRIDDGAPSTDRELSPAAAAVRRAFARDRLGCDRFGSPPTGPGSVAPARRHGRRLRVTLQAQDRADAAGGAQPAAHGRRPPPDEQARTGDAPACSSVGQLAGQRRAEPGDRGRGLARGSASARSRPRRSAAAARGRASSRRRGSGPPPRLRARVRSRAELLVVERRRRPRRRRGRTSRRPTRSPSTSRSGMLRVRRAAEVGDAHDRELEPLGGVDASSAAPRRARRPRTGASGSARRRASRRCSTWSRKPRRSRPSLASKRRARRSSLWTLASRRSPQSRPSTCSR